MRRPILNHTQPGELVYEPFLGSGTTLAAAEVTQRVADCQHRNKTTAFPPVLWLTAPSAGRQYSLYKSF